MTTKHAPKFDPETFLAKIGEGRKIVKCRRSETIFLQGDPADAVFYILRGKVQLTVVSTEGKQAVVGIFGAGDFFGEACLTATQVRLANATALTDCQVTRLERAAMLSVLRDEPEFSSKFISHLLSRNSRVEADLVDQLFNSSEKRLARVLLLLAHFGKDGKPEAVIPRVTQETLAEMVGTTRSRVSFFMNKFRKLGFIDYNDGLEVHSSLLGVVLHD